MTSSRCVSQISYLGVFQTPDEDLQLGIKSFINAVDEG